MGCIYRLNVFEECDTYRIPEIETSTGVSNHNRIVALTRLSSLIESVKTPARVSLNPDRMEVVG